MTKTITGLFDSMNDAQSAAKELMDRGISRDSISLVARESDNEGAQANEVGAVPVAGAVLGGAVGLLIGAGLLTIPIIGPVLAIGPLAAAIGSTAAAVGATALGAGIGAGIGGLAGGLMNAGVSEEDAHAYVEGVRRGGTLLTVSIEPAMAERVDVASVLHRYGVTDINQRSADWRAAGWNPGVHTSDTDANFNTNTDTNTRTNTDTNFNTNTRTNIGTNFNTNTRTNTDTGDAWQDSSKVGTGAGAATGAATGAVIGSVGGPVGTVLGGAAGAIVGAGTGAAGDVAGERSAPADSARNVSDYNADTRSPRDLRNQQSNGSFAQHDQDFQNHYQSTARAGGKPYDYYAPAYRFGYDMGGDTRYSSGPWETVEPALRSDWEQRHPNSWVEFKPAVRYSWEKVRGIR
jgi:hypothetical protein